MRTFYKILIANRGEIALRIMRTCRAMGISTVAVHSDADIGSLHVRFADEAVHIGPSPSKDSYLRFDRIIEAAERTGADAIHPGYGFLAENADFAEACESAGLAFIGPSPDSIRKMGLKGIAKKIMARAGVPIVPGFDEEDPGPPMLREKARTIGLPVLIKASAGGGGKGMRVVRSVDALEDALESSGREAEKAFGNGSLLVEKFVENARHVEVQILGDAHGNLIHLFERECSIQRRHQKIIEESPSPAVTPELRGRICEAAVAAGRAIGYNNAGTVEFILAPSGEFYFIEVNTRLQVEHPVTEMTTGLDLVRLQIEIAEGKPMTLAQESIRQMGHAVEARIYAEDPNNGFLPATGTVYDWDPPSSIEGIRIDSGIEAGTEVGIHYDPLLAKLIAHGPDRGSALRKLSRALRTLTLQGFETNRDFLIRLVEQSEFRAGRYNTGFITEHLNELTLEESTSQDLIAASVVALYLDRRRRAAAKLLHHLPSSYRNNPYRDPSMRLQVRDQVLEVSWRSHGDEVFEMECQDWQTRIRVVSFEPGRLRAAVDGIQQLYRIRETSEETGERFFVQSPSASRVVTRLPRYPGAQVASEHESAFAPMPGQVLKVLVVAGQRVSAGEPLVILEAMKMEQTLRAATDGVIEAILVKQGDVVAPGDVLVEIAAAQA